MSPDADPAWWVTRDWLAAKRRHVLGTLDGLDEEQAARTPLPSGWSLLGLVHHLALDVERAWIQSVLAGHDVDLADGGAWRVPAGWGRAEVCALYRREAAASDAVLDALTPGSPLARPPYGGAPYRTAHEVVHHVLVETATHAGQADAVRELIDGRRRLVVD